MIGKRVRILRGDHYGKIGEVVDAVTFPGVAALLFTVYIGNAETITCCAEEMEVIANDGR